MNIINKPLSLIVGDSLGKGFIIMGMLIASYYLPHKEFSNVALGYSIASTLWFFVDFGINIKGIRWLSKTKHRKYKSLASLRTIGGIFALILAIIFLVLDNPVISMFITGLLFRALSLDWVMRARMDYFYLGAVTLVSGLIFIISVLFSVWAGVLTAELLSMIYAASFLVFMISTRFFHKDFKIFFPRKRFLKDHFLSSIFFSISGLSVAAIIHMPIFILGFFGGYEYEISKIGVIILFINAASFLISIYVISIMPIMVLNSNQMKNKVSFIVSGIFAAITVYFCLDFYSHIKGLEFTFIEIVFPSAFIMLYAIRRLFDSELLLNKGEFKYMKTSLMILTFIFAIFSIGLSTEVAAIILLYGISIVVTEVIFLLFLRKS